MVIRLVSKRKLHCNTENRMNLLFSFRNYIVFFCRSVSNWKDVSTSSSNSAKNQFVLTIKNAIEPTKSKPMTYSCSNDTVN